MNPQTSQHLEAQQIQTLRAEQLAGLHLLQSPMFELQTLVDQAIVENPVLTTDIDEAPPTSIATEDVDWLDRIMSLPPDQRYIHHKGKNHDVQDVQDFIVNSIEQPQSFQSYMLDQLKLLDLPEEQYQATREVIEHLDEQGYLKTPPADIAMSAQLPLFVIERAIRTVQHMDPAGVGAKDIRERILLKLQREKRQNELIYTVVKNHLDALASNQIPQVAKKMQISIAQLNEILSEIQTIHTDLDFIDHAQNTPFIKPEVVVSIDEHGEPIANVLNDRVPQLYISQSYKKMLKDPHTSAEARHYIQGKIKDAAGFIQSLLLRQSTLKRIADAVVHFQRDFFLKGPSVLKPMTRQQIADICECHTSTVARTVDNKMLACHWGEFMMNKLFSSGVTKQDESIEAPQTLSSSQNDAHEVSTQVILNAIQKIVSDENPLKPLSDEKILKQLTTQGFEVARRTIAKYRDILKIPPSHLRKKFE